jgi:hypothetical protein
MNQKSVVVTTGMAVELFRPGPGGVVLCSTAKNCGCVGGREFFLTIFGHTAEPDIEAVSAALPRG